MKIIQIGASSKKAGKTALAEYLVGELKADFALKISSGGHHAGTGPITVDPDIISQPDTDTGRLVKAGAKSVIWVSARQSELEHNINKAFSMFAESGLLVVEGNSGSRYLHADFTAFIMDVPVHKFKKSAHTTLVNSDVVLAKLSDKLSAPELSELTGYIRKAAPNAEIIEFAEAEQDTAFAKAAEIIKQKLDLHRQ